MRARPIHAAPGAAPALPGSPGERRAARHPFPAHDARGRRGAAAVVLEELPLLELFYTSCGGAARSAGCVPHAHVVDGPRLAAFASSLPFELTGEQQRARDEILSALAAPAVANHMLLGDVGTGKTVVAGHALAAAADSRTGRILAPTEVLASTPGPGRVGSAGARRLYGLYGCPPSGPLSWSASLPGRWTCSSAPMRCSPTTSCRATSPWRSSTSSSASASTSGRSFWKRARRPTRCT